MPFSLANWIVEKVGKWLLHQEPPKRAYLCDFDKICYKIQPADVLLVEGRSRVSKIIKGVTQSPWSHAALYIGRLQDIKDQAIHDKIAREGGFRPDQQLLIESELGQGTIIFPIQKYKEDHLRILRPEWLSHKDVDKVIYFALSGLGRKYNLRQLFDLARFLLPWSIFPRRWRSSLFQRNALQPTEDICSSMIADAFESVNYPILPLIKSNGHNKLEIVRRNTQLYTPSDFDYSPFFSVIKYPIFPLGERRWYANLPWADGVSSDE